MSRVTAIISALVICIIVCLSWAVNHYRDNAITYKAQRDKNAELKLANAAITDMQMRQRDVAALDAKYTKELADAKAENDALRDDVAAGRRRLHIKAVCQSVREAYRLGVDNPDWQTPLNKLFHPPERLITMQKQLEGTQRSILMSSADRVAHIDGQLIWLSQQAIHALPAEYKCLKIIKPSNPFTNVCWVSVLTTFSAPPQILAASTVSSAQFRNEEMMGDGFLWCYCCRFVLNSKRREHIL